MFCFWTGLLKYGVANFKNCESKYFLAPGTSTWAGNNHLFGSWDLAQINIPKTPRQRCEILCRVKSSCLKFFVVKIKILTDEH